MKVLITAGGTRVPIDDVRHIGNMSSGAYGSLLAYEFYVMNYVDITYFIDEYSYHKNDFVSEDKSRRVKTIKYKDYYEYLTVKDLIQKEKFDVIISTAAVSDYIVDKIDGKISSNEDEVYLKLKKAEKVIKSFKELSPDSMVVGFKLLASPTEEEKISAIKKQLQYVDYVVYNDIDQIRKGNTHREVWNRQLDSQRIISPFYLMKYIKQEWRNRIN
jgi:phosphopantothenoylcysteine decarboxylase/phosphopantothenate--cysteine ligase